jgi:hypothetical protein
MDLPYVDHSLYLLIISLGHPLAMNNINFGVCVLRSIKWLISAPANCNSRPFVFDLSPYGHVLAIDSLFPVLSFELIISVTHKIGQITQSGDFYHRAFNKTQIHDLQYEKKNIVPVNQNK